SHSGRNLDVIEGIGERSDPTGGERGAYTSTNLGAAGLCHSLASKHAFHNGNKGVALLATEKFLSEYGYWVDRCDDDEMYEVTRQIADHEIDADRNNEVGVIADWLGRNSRKQQKGEKQLKLPALREALGRFDFELKDRGKTLEVLSD